MNPWECQVCGREVAGQVVEFVPAREEAAREEELVTLRARLYELDGVRAAYDRRGQEMERLRAEDYALRTAFGAELAAAERRGAEKALSAAARELDEDEPLDEIEHVPDWLRARAVKSP